MFCDLTENELFELDGGVSWEHIAAGATFTAIGIGCIAIAVIPGVNVLAATGLALAGSWGIARGTFSIAYGCTTP